MVVVFQKSMDVPLEIISLSQRKLWRMELKSTTLNAQLALCIVLLAKAIQYALDVCRTSIFMKPNALISALAEPPQLSS